MSDDNDAGRRKLVAKFLYHRLLERFSIAARKGMKKDEGRIFIESREWIAGGNRAAKPLANCGARAFGQLKMTVNRMPAAIDFGDAIVKPARPSARIAHPVNFFGAADFCDQRTAQRSLEIKRKIGPNFSGFLQPRKQTLRRADTLEFAAGKVDVIHIRISAEHRREFGVNQPCNLGAGIRLVKQPDCRKRVDDIAKRTWLND